MNCELGYNVQARINPVFFTAKTAICLMAKAGINDADKIVHCLKLEDNQPLQNMADSDTILGNAIVVEAKYRTMCSLIEKSGYNICVDLPCGYTPKALHLTEKNFRFIGLDLPIVAEEFAPIIQSLSAYPKNIFFSGVDATNYESLATALRDVDEPLCITTEGMMMYFTESEVDAVISNIRKILEVHGGCWITPDPEVKLQFMLTFRSVFDENFLGKLNSTSNTAMKQSSVANLSNSFIIDVENISSSITTVENLLKLHGLKVKRVNFAENMPSLSVYQQLNPAQIQQFKDAMRQCHCWIITLDETRKIQENVTVQKKSFEMNCTLEDGILQMTLRGRIDSISAPQILTAFETANDINAVKIDCSALEYISSAGIRLLIDMHKSCDNGLILFNVNSSVEKILSQNGFTEVEVNKWKLSNNL